MGHYEVEQPGKTPVAEELDNGGRAELRSQFGDLPPERPGEREALIAEVQKLERELERYRAHAERTSKLFLSVANYADWVRDNARRDAELTLRKARARVERLEAAAAALERTERELVSRQAELARLQALTDETRARLSAFLNAGLEALSGDVEHVHQDVRPPPTDDLRDALHGRLASTPSSPAGPTGDS